MTERYQNPQHDPRMPPQRLLLNELGKRMIPANETMRVLWGKHTTVLLGGMVMMRSGSDSTNEYAVAITTDPWRKSSAHAATRNEIMYDIHLIGETAGRRYGVCAGTTYTAETMGRLTTEKLTTEMSPDVSQTLARLIQITQFSKYATDKMEQQLGEWGVVEKPSELDYMYPDTMGVYHYMDTFYEEQQEQQE